MKPTAEIKLFPTQYARGFCYYVWLSINTQLICHHYFFNSRALLPKSGAISPFSTLPM